MQPVRPVGPLYSGALRSCSPSFQQAAKMSDKSCTIRTRKFITNRLLSRRQFVSAAPAAPWPRSVRRKLTL